MEKWNKEKWQYNSKWLCALAGTIVIAGMILTASLWKSELQIPIASDTDSTISMTITDNSLVQSWQASAKNIVGFQIPFNEEESQNVEGNLTVSVKEDLNSESSICSKTVSLAEVYETNEYAVEFKKTKLEAGKRYYVCLNLEEAAADTVVALNSNSGYGGMKIGNAEVPGALTGSIVYENTNNLAFLMKVFLVISGITYGLMILFKRKFEETLALTLGGIFAYLYLFGIFEQLVFGVQSLYVVSMLLALAAPFLAAYNNRKWSDLISPGFLAFWGLFAVYFILDRNVVAGKVDDLNHWQLCVRDMWYFDSYPFHPGSTLIAMRYTPGFATIEYFFLYMYGAYREGIILLACHTIGFATLSILYTGVSWKQCHKVIPLTALIAGLPLLIYQSHYGILYVDAYLGMLGAYILISYFTEEHSLFQVIRITVASILLIMTKEMGLAIAGTIYLMILADVFLKNKKWKLFLKDTRTKAYFLSGICALGSFLTWQVYTWVMGAKYGFTGSFNNALKLMADRLFADSGVNGKEQAAVLLVSNAQTGAFKEAVSQAIDAPIPISDATPLQTVKEMIHWLLFEKEFIGGSYGELTLIVILLCAALGFAGLYRKWKLPMKQIVISLLAGTGLYTVFLVVCYVFLFSEASAIPAARRYMGSYLLLFLITIVGVILVKANQEETQESWKTPFIWVVSLFVLLMIPENHAFYTTEANFGYYFTTWKNHQVIGEVFRSFADKDEKVYYVEYSDSNLVPQYNYLTFANAVVPNLTQGLRGGRKIVTSKDSPYQSYTVTYSREEWGTLLAEEYDYVYLRYADSYFAEQYGALFENQNEIENGAIFKVVVQEDGSPLLKKIAYKDLN